MIGFIKELIYRPLLNFIFPQICFGCEKLLLNDDEKICAECLNSLKKTNPQDLTIKIMKERFQNNGVLDNFYGLYYFENNGVLQKLLHQLKYENRKFIAEIFGDLIGNEIKENKLFEDNKLIIPIPLNKIKERERGYNQSLILAKRVSKILGINTLDNILFRKKYTKTQTQLNLQERKENIKDAFEVRNNELIKNQNIILVDDVITSGSTIEEAAKCLKNNGANKVISFSIAVAQLEDEIKSTKVEELEI